MSVHHDARTGAETAAGACERFEALMDASGRDVDMSRPLLALVRAEGRIERRFERVLAESGLSEPKFNVLMELAANDGRLPHCRLAERLLRSPANVTALIDRMERDGLVRRVRGEQDRRTVMAEITEQGWQALRVGAPLVFELERSILGHLAPDDRARLADLLNGVASEPTTPQA